MPSPIGAFGPAKKCLENPQWALHKRVHSLEDTQAKLRGILDKWLRVANFSDASRQLLAAADVVPQERQGSLLDANALAFHSVHDRFCVLVALFCKFCRGP